METPSERDEVIAHLKTVTAGATNVSGKEVSQLINYYKTFKHDLEVSTEVIRALRNVCAVNEDARGELSRSDTVLEILQSVLDNPTEEGLSEPDLVHLRCSWQLVHNALIGSPPLRDEVVKPLMQAVSKCLGLSDSKVQNYSSSVMLLMLKTLPKPAMEEFVDVRHLGLLLSCIHQDADFALFCVQTLIADYPGLVCQSYQGLEEVERLTLLHTLAEGRQSISTELVQLIVGEFKKRSTCLLTTMKDSSMVASPAETTELLSLLCELSCDVGGATQSAIQGDRSLLIDVVYLLRMVHDVGKSGEANMFTPIHKIAELGGGPEELSSNPAFGFKRDLVRLIGNMCWDHRGNQDLAREIDGIPLLLDCSAIDGKNPFIMQWVVFAIRNLCRNNSENQEAISKLEGRGIAVTTLSEEFGLSILKKN